MEGLWQRTRAYALVKGEKEKDVLSHAYLLIYEDERNLRPLLKTFAKLLFEPLNAEQTARRDKLIDEENFADCLFFPEDGKKLTVDDAEKIREESTLSPIEGERKVFVLGDFAEANIQTQNKLLKLLEEPPKGVTFLLGATSVYPVLQTVLSRTKRLEILPFSIEEITSALTRIYGNKYDKQTLTLCAAASGGVLGEAQGMLEGGSYKTLTESAFSLCTCDSARLPLLIKNIGETKYKKQLLSLLRLIFRDALLIKTGIQNSLLLAFEKERLNEVANLYPLPALLYAQEAIGKAEKEVQFNAVFPQCLELCISNIKRKN
jgi:DNA polymerase III gamma/tau subunit